jgi:hypothetical protein
MVMKKESLSLDTITFPEDYRIDGGGENDGMTQTLICAFNECRMKFLLMLNRWRALSKNKTRLFGCIMHDALAQLYKLEKLPTIVDITSAVNNVIIENPDIVVGVDLDQRERDIEVCKVMLEYYVKYYSEDWTKAKFNAIEKTFDIIINGARLRGKRDARFSLKNKIWQMEHKSKSRIVEDTLKLKLCFDFQCLFYILTDEAETHEDITGTLYNIVRNPQIKLNKDGLKNYIERVRADIEERKDFYFIRYELPYTAIDKARFEKDLFANLDEIKRVLADRKLVYKNTTSCDKGFFQCEFLSSCAGNKICDCYQAKKLFTELNEE